MYRSYLSRNEFSFIRTARWAAIQKAMRSRALPRLESVSRPRNCPDWHFGEIQAAVLEELAMMPEAPEVPTLGEDHHGQDRRDAR